MSSLARLVLDKAALCGLKVSVWDAPSVSYEDGIIEDYHAPSGAYIVVGESSRKAVQFHQFTIEEEGEDLVLKVTRCALAQLPPGVSPDLDADAAAAAGGAPDAAPAAAGGGAGPEADGGAGSDAQEGAGGGEETQGAGGAKEAATALHAKPQGLPSPGTSRQGSMGLGSGEAGMPPYMSPQPSNAAEQLAALVGAQFSSSEDGFEAVLPAESAGRLSRAPSLTAAGGAGAGGAPPAPSRLGGGTRGPGAGSGVRISSGGAVEVRRLSSAGGSQALAAAAAASAVEAAPASGLARAGSTSLQEQGGSSSHQGPEPASGAQGDPGGWESPKCEGGGGAALGFWGTPVKGDGAAPSPQRERPPHVRAQEEAAARRSAGFDEISQMISAGGAQAGAQQQAGTGAAGSPHAAEARPLGGDLPVAAAVAEAQGDLAAAVGAPGAAAAAGGDFVISTAAGGGGEQDVGAGPLSARASLRASRSNLDQEQLATDEGMMVDMPQPLSSRRASRTSARDSQPGAAGAGEGAPGSSAAPLPRASPGGGGAGAPRASARGAPPPLPGGWRLSRQASGRVSGGGDQDGSAAWGAVEHQQQQHGSGAVSRRVSRTLSGRLPPDQEPAAPAAMAALEETAADVAPRPAGAAASRRSSAAGPGSGGRSGRGTPDSDGFGYSGFEESAPEPPPPARQELRRRSSRLLGSDGGRGPSPPSAAAGDPAAGVSSAVGGAAAAIAAARSLSLQQRRQSGDGPERTPSDDACGEPQGSAGGAEPGPQPRRVSRALSGVLQAAAAAAAAAEDFIGRHLSGGGAVALGPGQQRPPSGRNSRLASRDERGLGSEPGAAATGAGAAEAAGAVLPSAAARLADSFVAAPSLDSFSAPPLLPFGSAGSGALASGGSLMFPAAKAPALAAPSLNPFADGLSAAQRQVAAYEAAQLAQPRLAALDAALGPKGAAATAAAKAGGLPGLGLDLAGGALGGAGGAGGGGAAGGAEDDEVMSARIGTRLDADGDGQLGPASAAAPLPGAAGGGGGAQEATARRRAAFSLGASFDEITPADDAGPGSRAGSATKARSAGGRLSSASGSVGPSRSASFASFASMTERERRAARRQWQEARAARGASAGGRGEEGGEGGEEDELPPPPSYAESVGGRSACSSESGGSDAGDDRAAGAAGAASADADDERGSSADGAAAGAGAGGGAGSGAAVRSGAALDGGATGAPRPGAAAAAGVAAAAMANVAALAAAPGAGGPPPLPPRTASGRLLAPAAGGWLQAPQSGAGAHPGSAPGAGANPYLQQLYMQQQLQLQQQQQQYQQQLLYHQQLRRSLSLQRAASGQPQPARAPSGGADGVMLVGMPAYGYDDDCAPLVAHHMSGVYASGQLQALQEARRQTGRVVLHALCGNAPQWYDCMAFALMGAQIGAAMMPAGAALFQRLQLVFVLFAAGHALRPVGALVWPAVSRRFGWRAMAGWTMALTAFPAALIGALPNYQQAGYVGAALMSALRLLQGAALGANSASAAAHLSEHAQHPSQSPCLLASLVPLASALGTLAAAGTCFVAAWCLDGESLGTWGWRLPLVAGLLVNLVAAVPRIAVLRDPQEAMSLAEIEDRHAVNLGRTIRQGWRRVLGVAAMGTFPAASFYLVCATLPAYLLDLSNIAPHVALGVHLANLVALCAAIPLGGWLADSAGRTSVMMTCAAAAAALAYPVWMLVGIGLPAVAWLGQLLLVAGLGIFQGAAVESGVMAMPKGMRATAYNLADALATAFGGGLAPLAGVSLIAATGDTASPAYVMIGSAVLSAAACWVLRRTDLA